ncbi:MAG TPA: ABC transporter ATP-binding protein/permease [Candidatus Blautia gallistercoris]|uniref:ABC transporter ATP-binding protein/permease n=1 Tax=Candidatus Blautia gallistercoris TaxID=2838490 RepID=A0A9D1WHV9_9FIRM|nr:ABC transporter ATP-binding protein/permease [Candidatus Blautia gallistercoris]
MFKLFKYLKRYVGLIVGIVVLLFLQAFCDLSLPDYTARIVNVGIQQQGIEDGVPDQIRITSLNRLKLFMTEEEQAVVDSFYTEDGDVCRRGDVTEEEREELDQIFSPAMMIASELASDNETTAALKENMGLPADADLLAAIEQAPGETLAQMQAGIEDTVNGLPESIVSQAAVAYVRAEYEALGLDVDGIQMRYLAVSGGKMLGLAFLGVMAAITITFLSARVAATMGHDLRNMVYRKVIGFSSGEFHRFSTASLITRSTNDIQQIQLVMAMMFRIVLYAPILGIGGVLKVLNTNASMTWILGLAVVLILLVVIILFSVAMPKFTKLQKLIDRLNLVTREILTGIPVIRAFSREKHEEERFEKANRDLTRTNLFVNRCMTFMMPVMMLIMNGVSVLIIYSGAYAVDGGSMQVGDVMAFIQYAMQIIMSFLMITMMSIMLPRANVSAVRINEVLETEVSIRQPEDPKEPSPDVKGMVEFDHVTFAYPDGDENVLEDITFTARKGETVAFIGSTGSGKSTLVNLIPRFYDVTKGAVRVDGVDVREMDEKVLRDKLGYVPQKGVLFSGTIASNISYGCPDASSETIEKAAEIAQAADFIEEKEKKYQSPIAQGGTNVSGGQKQRLSIARAIAKNPEIFIFDDSFSALDYKTDATLRKALKKATKDATTLIVAQRISTILHADRIIVLDEGRMAGQGTHQELMKNCQVYREIAMSQLSEEELANE